MRINQLAGRGYYLRMGVACSIALTVYVTAGAGTSVRAQQRRAISTAAQSDVAPSRATLAPTIHPPLPRELSQYWFAPDRESTASRSSSATLGAAARFATRGDHAKALATISQTKSHQGLLADYSTYYVATSQLQLLRASDALKTFKALRERKPVGYLSEAAALGEAAAHEALDDPASAIAVYEGLIDQRPMRLDQVYMRLGLAARLAHQRNKAADAFGHVYYEFALSEHTADAAAQLALLDVPPATSGGARYKLELGRAERIFGTKDYAAARAAFEALRPRATEDDRPLIRLRLAECDLFLKRARIARDSLWALIDDPQRGAEAYYYYALAARDLGDAATYLRISKYVVEHFPTSSWAEEALNGLATYYIRRDDDAAADEVLRELYAGYPRGIYGERAAWKIGWRSYRQKRFDETVRYFEQAAADFPRSDYRPSWLYWSGRARQQLNDRDGADQRFSLAVMDYLNTYYGRLAAKRLGPAKTSAATAMPERVVSADVILTPGLPPTAPLIRALLVAELYDDAVNEIRYAQKVWGDSPALQATLAWTSVQQSVGRKGMEQFQLLRGSINTMRRAYPQFMTAGGEELPREVLTVIFPLAYWDLIKKNSAANNLDPYLMAALMAQESTFVADIRSHANAWGLMQLMPFTARDYARKLKIKYSSRLLTDPVQNVRIGTLHFADAMKEFGDVALALAAYNAGPRPVRQWVKERPGVEREEFIDDIPYPETQNYVKRILGTAEDYRRLYGPQETIVNSR